MSSISSKGIMALNKEKNYLHDNDYFFLFFLNNHIKDVEKKFFRTTNNCTKGQICGTTGI